MPEGQLASKARLIRAAGLRWPVEESFELAKGCFGLDQCQARLYTAVLRHLVLVMAALAVCAVTAAQLRERTDSQAPPPAGPTDGRPADPGLVPLSVREVKHLLAAALRQSRAGRPRRQVAPVATPPPGTIPLVPQTRTPDTRPRPGQLAIADCRTRRTPSTFRSSARSLVRSSRLICRKDLPTRIRACPRSCSSAAARIG